MAKLRGSKEGFLNHIKLWLEEGLSKPELLNEYIKAAIKNIDDEIKKNGFISQPITTNKSEGNRINADE